MNNCYEQHSVPSTLCQRDPSTRRRWRRSETSFQTIAQSTLATTSAAEAVKKAVEDNKSSTPDSSKLIAKPNIFDYRSQDDEIKAFREWSWVFEKCLSAVDEGYTGPEGNL